MSLRDLGFAVHAERQASDMRVCVSGALDVASVGEVASVLREQRDCGRSVIIDLSGVMFMDSSVLRLLLEAQDDADQDGCRLAVDPDVTGPVRRLLELTGVRDSLRWLAS